MQNLSVLRVDHDSVKPWILQRHYARRMCSISFSFGLYDGNELVGVCTFGSPASPFLCKGVCGEHNKDYVIELNRLIVDERRSENTLSWFVSKCLKSLPPRIVVSYADTSKGHHGYIYQATNWLYTGLTMARKERGDVNNPDKHSRNLWHDKNISVEYAYRDRPQKHRYVFFTGSKKQNRKWRSELKYEIFPYPKGPNSRYDINPIYSQSRLF